jgi:hypothetical protein
LGSRRARRNHDREEHAQRHSYVTFYRRPAIQEREILRALRKEPIP